MYLIEEDLSEYLGMPLDEVVNKAMVATKTVGEKWQEFKGCTEDFYHNNGEYLFDLLALNANANWLPKVMPVLKVTDNHLDIGCGIGTLCLLKALQGHPTTGYDVNESVLKFARFRAKKYDYQITFTSERPDYSQYKVLTAIDVLEHIENLGEFLKDVGREVKSGTFLYHVDCFGFQDTSPMHFDHSNKINEYLEEAGFRAITKQWAMKI